MHTSKIPTCIPLWFFFFFKTGAKWEVYTETAAFILWACDQNLTFAVDVSDSWIMLCCQTVLQLCWKYLDISFTFGKNKRTQPAHNKVDREPQHSIFIRCSHVFGWLFFSFIVFFFYIGSYYIVNWLFWITWKGCSNPITVAHIFSNELKNICLSS